MRNRDFSDTVKLKVIRANLEKHCGMIGCDICGCNLLSIAECHFDHIYPVAKGGRSTFENCQLLCADCNLKKNDKELKDFVLAQKAKSFLSGEPLRKFDETRATELCRKKEPVRAMTKEEFAKVVAKFIGENGNISKIDFARENNGLPSIHYVRQYYGSLNALKKEFGITDISYNWDRESIKNALTAFVSEHGKISQKDMKKGNGLPSVSCVIRHYPEYKSFTDIKRELCGLDAPIRWTRENAVEYGKRFVGQNGNISEKDLCTANRLPSSYIVHKLFGTLAEYKAAVGVASRVRNDFISKNEIANAVERYFAGRERVIESKKAFCETFEISPTTISKRYGVFSAFCEEQGIKVLVSRKGKYSKREVDDFISKWVKMGNEIPNSHDLSKLGLPSRDVILKYYENWREPFYIYKKLYEELNRHG